MHPIVIISEGPFYDGSDQMCSSMYISAADTFIVCNFPPRSLSLVNNGQRSGGIPLAVGGELPTCMGLCRVSRQF